MSEISDFLFPAQPPHARGWALEMSEHVQGDLIPIVSRQWHLTVC